jgi:hypothetical protein
VAVAAAGASHIQREAVVRKRIVLPSISVAVLVIAVPLLQGGEQPAQQAPSVRLTALQQERVNVAKQGIELLDRSRENGTGGTDAEFGDWERRLFDAETAAAVDKAGRVAAAERYAESTRKRAERVQKFYEAGQTGQSDLLRARYDLAAAEAALEELKAK